MARPTAVAIAIGAALALAPPAWANLLKDPSFERPAVPEGDYTIHDSGTSIGAWRVVGNGDVGLTNGSYTRNEYRFPAHGGKQMLDLTGLANSSGGVAQIVETEGGTCTLSFWLGNVSGDIWGTTSTAIVYVNSDEVARFTNSDPGTTVSWKQYTQSFPAKSGDLKIEFRNADPGDDNSNVVEDVDLTCTGGGGGTGSGPGTPTGDTVKFPTPQCESVSAFAHPVARSSAAKSCPFGAIGLLPGPQTAIAEAVGLTSPALPGGADLVSGKFEVEDPEGDKLLEEFIIAVVKARNARRIKDQLDGCMIMGGLPEDDPNASDLVVSRRSRLKGALLSACVELMSRGGGGPARAAGNRGCPITFVPLFKARPGADAIKRARAAMADDVSAACKSSSSGLSVGIRARHGSLTQVLGSQMTAAVGGGDGGASDLRFSWAVR